MEENKFVEFTKRHLWSILMVVATLISLAVLVDRKVGAKKNISSQDYLTVRKITERLNKGEPLSVQSIEMLEKILARHPELHPPYDSLLTLSFYHQENVNGARKQISSALERGQKSLSSHFVDYTEGTLLITEGQYESALAKAIALEEKLGGENEKTLHAFNLLRIAFLAKKLQNSSLLTETVRKIESLPNYSEIAPLFQEGSYTLKEYFS